jgi:hypothetical protein
MTGKEFAEKYAGRKVKITYEGRNYEAIISGYYGGASGSLRPYVLLILITDSMYFPKNDRKTFGDCIFTNEPLTEEFRWTFRNFYDLSLIQNNDDCLDCGAKDDEPCKDTCPNR